MIKTSPFDDKQAQKVNVDKIGLFVHVDANIGLTRLI
jgi:hypothetical protein